MKIKRFLSIILLSVVLVTSCVYATSENSMCSKIESFIYTFGNQQCNVEYIKPLKDIDGNYEYDLYSVDEFGYAIVVRKNNIISEIKIGDVYEKEELRKFNYYLGPANLSINRTNFSDEEIYKQLSEQNQAIIGRDLLNYHSNDSGVVIDIPQSLIGGTYRGISDANMNVYKSIEWQNTDVYGYDYTYLGFGICGSISTAIGLSILDRYENSNVIVNSPYSFGQPEFAEWLILWLKSRIEPPLPGSSAYDIIQGINSFYDSYYSNLPSNTLVPTGTSNIAVMKNSLLFLKPVIHYLPGGNVHPYGPHWVCSYGYIDYNNELWFKAVDTWGNLAWINSSWITTGVYFY